jgi:hypothetical protein
MRVICVERIIVKNYMGAYVDVEGEIEGSEVEMARVPHHRQGGQLSGAALGRSCGRFRQQSCAAPMSNVLVMDAI